MGIKFEHEPEVEDRIQCECAVMGIIGHSDSARIALLGLHGQQHRGQEGAGIATAQTANHKKPEIVKGLGLALEAISEQDIKDKLVGDLSIGHNRYSTAGSSDLVHTQPHESSDPPIAFCANGDIIPDNYNFIRNMLANKGVYFNSRNDSELTVKFIAYYMQKGLGYISAIRNVQGGLIGSYSALMLFEGKLIAFRDPRGMRPLVYGKTKYGWAIASETCALDIVGAKFVRDVEPGEILVFEQKNSYPNFYKADKPVKPAHCVFEQVYFSRPDSVCEGIHVGSCREAFGRRLYQKCPTDADLVISVPDSGNDAALGYAEESCIPFKYGIRRSHYDGRSFIKPVQSQRDETVRRKHNPDSYVINGKRLIVVDDSIVRGTTTKQIVKMLRGAGAKEVHVRISSPPVKFSCFYGINTPDRNKLIGSYQTIDDIREFIGADSLVYLSVQDMRDIVESFGKNPDHYCYACFDGNYPTKI